MLVNQEVLQAAPKVVSKLQSVIQEAKLELSLMDGSKEGNSKLLASNNFLESSILGPCEDEGIGVGDSVEYFRIDVRNQTQKLGKREKKEV